MTQTTHTRPSMTRNIQGLTLDQIKEIAPSVFAPRKYEGDEEHKGCSKKYTYLSTGRGLEDLYREGFVATMARQSRSRIPGKEPYTRHQVCLRKREHLGDRLAETHEIILTNSHDRTSAWVIEHGIYRLVCSNGLRVYDPLSRLHVPHKGNISERVLESTLQLAQASERVMERIRVMKRTRLSPEEQMRLAEVALRVRFDLDRVDTAMLPTRTIYQPADFLRVQLAVDTGDDAWTLLNRVQMNAIGGGLSRYDDKGKKRVTRAVNGIEQSDKINTRLWREVEEILATR